MGLFFYIYGIIGLFLLLKFFAMLGQGATVKEALTGLADKGFKSEIKQENKGEVK